MRDRSRGPVESAAGRAVVVFERSGALEWEATALLESFRPPLDDFRGFGSNVVFLGKGTVGVSELGAGLFGDRQGPGGEGSFLYLYLLGGGGGD